MGSATQALAFKFFAQSTTEEDEETGEDEGDQIQPNGGPNQSELGFGRCSEQVVAVNQGLKHEEHDYRRGMALRRKEKKAAIIIIIVIIIKGYITRRRKSAH